ncbi:MAG: hypothetical protein QOH88_3122 [Verrucomicrobiota bacterium]|jgi:hypothetical protein
MNIVNFVEGLLTGSALIAMAGWLSRALIGHLLKKDLAAFKAQEEEKIGKTLATLSDTFAKQNIKLTWLHQQRAVKIGEIHGALVDLRHLVKVEAPEAVEANREPVQKQTRELDRLLTNPEST